MKITSPTGTGEVRHDAMGSGSFGAPRGRRRHNGTDFVCVPGSVIYAPISGTIVREAFPYAGDLKWSGCLLTAKGIQVKMFYMRLYHHIRKHFPHLITEGTPIGIAQDISSKHGDKMIPHVHMEVKTYQFVNPEELM